MKKIGKVLIVVVLVLVGVLLWLRRFSGHVEQKAVNPGHSTVAEVRLNTIAAATDANVISVRLYPSILGLGDTVFDASTYGGSIRVSWQDGSHLIVHMEHPDQLEVHRQMKEWKGIKINYQNE